MLQEERSVYDLFKAIFPTIIKMRIPINVTNHGPVGLTGTYESSHAPRPCPSGPTGPSGPSGISGPSGPSGPTGPNGPNQPSIDLTQSV